MARWVEWPGGLGGSVLGARCLEDAPSFGAVVSQQLRGGKCKHHTLYSISSMCDIFYNF